MSERCIASILKAHHIEPARSACRIAAHGFRKLGYNTKLEWDSETKLTRAHLTAVPRLQDVLSIVGPMPTSKQRGDDTLCPNPLTECVQLLSRVTHELETRTVELHETRAALAKTTSALTSHKHLLDELQHECGEQREQLRQFNALREPKPGMLTRDVFERAKRALVVHGD